MQNLEIEKSVLSQLLIDRDLLLENPVQESDFSLPLHQNFFAELKRSGGNLAIAQQKFSAEEQGYLLEIAGLSLGTWRWKSDRKELKRLSELRRLDLVAKQVLRAIESDQDLENIYEKIAKFETGEIKEIKLDQVLQEIVAEITGTKQTVLYPSGYQALDRYLGGFTPGQLNIIAARPSVGKTLFAMNVLLKQVESGTKSAFFSLEMSNKEIVQRILAKNSGMPVRAMKSQASKEQLQKVNQAMEKLEKQLKRLILIDTVFDAGELYRTIKLLHKKEQVQIVYIDYLGLIQGKGENRNLEISKITRSLKMLAMQLGIVIVLLSQLNRGSENRPDKAPRLANLRDSGAIEQDADCVLMLERDLEDEPKRLKIYVRKNRNGSLGECELACEPASMQVGNLETKPF